MTRPVTLRFPGRPPLLNEERSSHWSEHRGRTRLLREEATWRALAAKMGRLDEVEVRSWPTYPDRRSWPDVGGWFPATKAIIDGLVNAGVLRADTPDVVRRLTFDPPRIGERAELVVVVIPWVRAYGGSDGGEEE